ncbi:hypothetical protein N0V88_007159 [Collariella sp. IMI 366227]|nr:hypothetical protein N0V88_007159 [Collariella sp. IMI 366227]
MDTLKLSTCCWTEAPVHALCATVLHLFLTELRGRWDRESWMETRAIRQLTRLFLSKGADPFLYDRPLDTKQSPVEIAVDKENSDFANCVASQTWIDLVGRLTTAEIELLFCLMALHRSRRLASDVDFICAHLDSRHPVSFAAELAQILCFRSLKIGSFYFTAKLTLLRAAVKGGRWPIAQQLVKELPEISNINELDKDGQSLLSKITCANFKYQRDVGLDLGVRLVLAGAVIHLCITAHIGINSSFVNENERIMTPLNKVLRRPEVYNMAEMLRLQPVRGNPPAEQAYHLH